MTIKEMIDAIREVVSKCDRDIPETDVLAALLNESESWQMRQQELEGDEE